MRPYAFPHLASQTHLSWEAGTRSSLLAPPAPAACPADPWDGCPLVGVCSAEPGTPPAAAPGAGVGGMAAPCSCMACRGPAAGATTGRGACVCVLPMWVWRM